MPALCFWLGDMVPGTIAGKFVGALCASIGVVLLAIPAGIFISEVSLESEMHLLPNTYIHVYTTLAVYGCVVLE